jgi:ubiquinone/menaquinone biosynthesis C-methylase UbiE
MTKRPYDVEIRERFDLPQVAAEYVNRKNRLDNDKNRREMACIGAALTGIQPGSRVLDLPTGTGRLIPTLLRRGFEVIAADYSEHMLGQAQQHFSAGQIALTDEELSRLSFVRQDIMAIDLPDLSVDLSISNRLFHHYPTSELRQRALMELARVTKTTIIVSYFSNVAISALRFHAKNLLRNRKPIDRVPIWPREFAADIAAAGLRVEATYPIRYGVSPQTYLRLGKAS